MKKTISVMLIITMLMSLLYLTSFAASTSLVAAPSTANKGDTVTISVNVGSGLSGAKLVLEYDTSCFSLVSNSISEGSNFMVSVNDKTAGKLTAAAVAMTEQPACTVYSAKFKVLKTGGKMTLKVTEAIDGNNNDITSTVTGKVLTIAEGTGTATEETIAPQPQTTAAANVTKPASGAGSSKTTTTKKIEGITGTAVAPAPDETLPADIMPTEPTTADSASEQTEKSHTAAIIIAVAATLLVLAAAIIIALIIKKKKQQDEPEAPNETNENINKDK
jgi:hypothetical protein